MSARLCVGVYRLSAAYRQVGRRFQSRQCNVIRGIEGREGNVCCCTRLNQGCTKGSRYMVGGNVQKKAWHKVTIWYKGGENTGHGARPQEIGTKRL